MDEKGRESCSKAWGQVKGVILNFRCSGLPPQLEGRRAEKWIRGADGLPWRAVSELTEEPREAGHPHTLSPFRLCFQDSEITPLRSLASTLADSRCSLNFSCC